MLLFIAFSIGLGSIVASVYVNVAVSPQAGTMLGNSVGRSLIFHVSNSSDAVAADNLISLADNSPLPCSFPSLRSQLGLGNLSFRIDLSTPLNVNASVTGSGIAVTVMKSGHTDPVEAFLRLYVLDTEAQSVEQFTGETNVDGSAFFPMTLANSQTAAILAKAGSSVGFATFSAQGDPLTPGGIYLKDGRMHGGNQSSAYVFGFEDWAGPVPPGGAVDVTGYSLPVVLLYQDNSGVTHYSTYPWLGGCGPTPVQATGVYVSDQTFLVRLQGGSIILLRLRVWGPGGK